MSVQREWIAAGEMPLPAAARWLVERGTRGGGVDLSGFLVVTPGLRSRERMLELLVEGGEARGESLSPPELISVGELPERLYDAVRPQASPLLQRLAWVHAMDALSADRLRPLVGVSELSAGASRLPLAGALQALYEELAGEGLGFSEVWQRRIDVGEEAERWEVLSAIESAYVEHLSALGFHDPHAARRDAVQRGAVHGDMEVVLVGTVDLNRVTRQLLAAPSLRVTALVFAASGGADDFDEFGCLRVDAWVGRRISIDGERLVFADRPGDQAAAVAGCLAQAAERYSADEITIGIADRSLVPSLERELARRGLESRNALGRRLSELPPMRLLVSIAAYAHRQRFTDFADLVRHPDVFEYLSQRLGARDWLESVDRFQHQVLPDRLGLGGRLPAAAHRCGLFPRLHAEVSRWLEPLAGGARPLREWGEGLLAALQRVYGERQVDPRTAEGRSWMVPCEILEGLLSEMLELPAAGDLPCDLPRALTLIHADERSVAMPAGGEAIDLAGWLEIPLDDAPLVIITGMNEGMIPSAAPSLLLLNDRLRTVLGIANDDRRLARDAYALSLLLGSPREVWLIAGRRSGEDDPLHPSRLIFAADDEAMIDRAEHFFQATGEAQDRYWLADPTQLAARQQLPIPPPEVEAPLTSLSVTRFKRYLQCPYRFYLENVAKLESWSDDGREMPPDDFGRLVHSVMESWAGSDLRDSADAAAIAAFLQAELERIEREKFGEAKLPAVAVQLERLRRRLDAVARLQARRRGEGWLLVHAEVPNTVAELLVDGEPFEIHGRIDRIDRHETTGQFAIFDYKTGDAGKRPDEAHRQQGNWIDLQLPLYRHLARRLIPPVEGEVQLGYILVPKKESEVDIAVASWSQEELESADEAARQVIRGIRSSRYWPPAEPPPRWQDAWVEVICQDRVFERYPLEVATAADSPAAVASAAVGVRAARGSRTRRGR